MTKEIAEPSRLIQPVLIDIIFALYLLAKLLKQLFYAKFKLGQTFIVADQLDQTVLQHVQLPEASPTMTQHHHSLGIE